MEQLKPGVMIFPQFVFSFHCAVKQAIWCCRVRERPLISDRVMVEIVPSGNVVLRSGGERARVEVKRVVVLSANLANAKFELDIFSCLSESTEFPPRKSRCVTTVAAVETKRGRRRNEGVRPGGI